MVLKSRMTVSQCLYEIPVYMQITINTHMEVGYYFLLKVEVAQLWSEFSFVEIFIF